VGRNTIKLTRSIPAKKDKAAISNLKRKPFFGDDEVFTQAINIIILIILILLLIIIMIMMMMMMMKTMIRINVYLVSLHILVVDHHMGILEQTLAKSIAQSQH
jgi:flagellar basal body-associated protein FliL